MQRKHVIVVGAGMAGLSAAYTLAQDDRIAVTVLEARDRIGGRVHSKKINGYHIDFGGFVIYPWYTQTRKIIDSLGLTQELSPIHGYTTYVDYIEEDKHVFSRGPSLTKKKLIQKSIRAIPRLFANLNMAHPRLRAFKNMTISAYLDVLFKNETPALQHEIKKYFSTIHEGYCYGPIDTDKAAFGFPVVAKTMLQGDVHVSDYFKKHGTNILPLTMADIIEKKGGKIYTKASVKKISGLHIETHHDEKYTADAIIFAQNVESDVFSQIMDIADTECIYTHFITAVIQVSHMPNIADDNAWGAVFHAPDMHKDIQLLSTINVDNMSEHALHHHLMGNIVIRNNESVLTNTDIRKLIADAFEDVYDDILGNIEVVSYEHWKKTMPIAQEGFVEKIRAMQGQQQYYFAGDYLGMPSIETAVATGVDAAKMCMKDLL